MKSKLTCFLLFLIGCHYFYLNKVFTGFLYIFTFGGFGFWWFIDIFRFTSMVDKYNETAKLTNAVSDVAKAVKKSSEEKPVLSSIIEKDESNEKDINTEKITSKSFEEGWEKKDWKDMTTIEKAVLTILGVIVLVIILFIIRICNSPSDNVSEADIEEISIKATTGNQVRNDVKSNLLNAKDKYLNNFISLTATFKEFGLDEDEVNLVIRKKRSLNEFERALKLKSYTEVGDIECNLVSNETNNKLKLKLRSGYNKKIYGKVTEIRMSLFGDEPVLVLKPCYLYDFTKK